MAETKFLDTTVTAYSNDGDRQQHEASCPICGREAIFVSWGTEVERIQGCDHLGRARWDGEVLQVELLPPTSWDHQVRLKAHLVHRQGNATWWQIDGDVYLHEDGYTRHWCTAACWESLGRQMAAERR